MLALNLQMPSRVPRTEYSAEGHWDLIKAVTGLEVGVQSPPQLKQRASLAFRRAWHYDLHWSTLIGRQEFGSLRTDMGHAEYAAGGVDRRDTVHCPFSDVASVLDFDFFERFGAVDVAAQKRRFEQHYRQQASELDGVCMTGVYITLVSGLIDLLGWDMLLLSAGEDPRRFGELADRYAQWIGGYFAALAQADVPVVMVHDDIVWSQGPFLAPAWYRKHVFPHYRRFFEPILASGKKLLFTSDGNYTMFLDDIVACGVSGVVMEPLTDMAYFAHKYGRTHAFIGNADTRILLAGRKPAIRAEVERCMAIGKGCAGFIMAVGNHIPANTPVEAAIYYNQVYEELSRR
jgi:hypothetical protein